MLLLLDEPPALHDLVLPFSLRLLNDEMLPLLLDGTLGIRNAQKRSKEKARARKRRKELPEKERYRKAGGHLALDGGDVVLLGPGKLHCFSKSLCLKQQLIQRNQKQKEKRKRATKELEISAQKEKR
ncbi:hypothetical protein QOT17_000096 [Balamuthia mandrillaris]